MPFTDVPSDNACWLVNQKLWAKFEKEFNQDNGFMPRPEWTEAEVVQYLDQKETAMTKEIFILDEDYVWSSSGTVCHMYLVDRDSGDYKPYDSESILRDVGLGLSILVRPATQKEIEWADRKLNFYKSSIRARAKKEFALD